MYISIQKFEQLLTEQGKKASTLRGVLAPATITKILHGQDVSARTVEKLAKVLGVAPYRLQGPGFSVMLNRAALTVSAAALQLTVDRVLMLAGVQDAETKAINNNEPITLGAAWRIADTLGVALEQILA